MRGLTSPIGISDCARRYGAPLLIGTLEWLRRAFSGSRLKRAHQGGGIEEVLVLCRGDPRGSDPLQILWS